MDSDAGAIPVARAPFIAIPPVSHDLPAGDHAVMAIADGVIMIALVDGPQTCARFIAPNIVRGHADKSR